MVARLSPASHVTSILCEKMRLDVDEALSFASGGMRRLRRLQLLHVELRYKPHWRVAARLAPRYGRTLEEVEVHVVVDGLTSVARCRRPGDIERDLGHKEVEAGLVAAPSVDAEAAETAARQSIRQLAHRKRAILRQVQSLELYFKPVYLLSEAPDVPPRYVVDAHTGALARALP
ncbi:MAG: hypothetical protein H0U16_11620 [Actinobacteria bacterium]|nr:hypothetical protein [Actinomycetota bacterium]